MNWTTGTTPAGMRLYPLILMTSYITTPARLPALEEEYGQKCMSLACIDHEQKVRAVLPLFSTRGLPFAIGRHSTGRRLSSLPRTPVAGLLAVDPAAASEILCVAMEIARNQKVQLEIKAQIGGLDRLVEGLGCVPWRFSYVEQLPTTAEGEWWHEFCDDLRLPRDCEYLAKDAAVFDLAMQSSNIALTGPSTRRSSWALKFERQTPKKTWRNGTSFICRQCDTRPCRRGLIASSKVYRLHGPKGQMRLFSPNGARKVSENIVAGSIFLKFGADGVLRLHRLCSAELSPASTRYHPDRGYPRRMQEWISLV